MKSKTEAYEDGRTKRFVIMLSELGLQTLAIVFSGVINIVLNSINQTTL